jgi:predicted lipid-binding transport protein (Tim44 family)
LLVGGAFVLVRAFLGRNSPSRQPAMQYSGFGAQPRAAPVFPAAAPAAALRNVPNVPAGFDQEGFLRGAKMNFIKLQVANDARDLETLRELTTPSMFDNLESDIRSRPASQQTDVVSVDADLLELVEEGGQYVASVRFAGMVRESVGTPPAEFSEVWHLVKPIDGSGGWLLAGIQQD